jgi:hypothetical protein
MQLCLVLVNSCFVIACQSRCLGPSGPFFFDWLTLKMEPKVRPETAVTYHQQKLCEHPVIVQTSSTRRWKPQTYQISQRLQTQTWCVCISSKKARNWTEDESISCKQIRAATVPARVDFQGMAWGITTVTHSWNGTRKQESWLSNF